jgi:hypothetical protein
VLPAWLAVTKQEPAPTIVTVVPDTVQTPVVVDENVTVRPDEAVAPIVKGTAPKTTLLSALNVIICVTCTLAVKL